MNFSLIETAAAQAASTGAQQPSTFDMLLMPIGLLVIFYFFLIRPQAKKHRDQQSLVAALKAGDEVITTGGIIGRVKSIADTFVTIEVGGATLKVVKEHVQSLAKPLQTPAVAKS
jgi:preprotein translocase subunit YajC